VIRVKICGITRVEDARHAARCGADAIGLVFAESPRKVSLAEAKKISAAVEPLVATVGVFVDQSPEKVVDIARHCRLTAVQLHGDEKESDVRKIQRQGYRVLKAFRIAAKEDLRAASHMPADALLFDSSVAGKHGGTGQAFDWKLLRAVHIERPWFVSGGLNPKNLKELLRTVAPYGVDVSSGVESAPGKKSPELVKEFIRYAKSAR
jgi:phosphoribosylanthranilate isomerase